MKLRSQLLLAPALPTALFVAMGVGTIWSVARLARTAKTILADDYVDLEGRPTRVAPLLLVSPSDRSRYAALLSRLAHEFSKTDVRETLLGASSAEEVRKELRIHVWGQTER